MLTKVMPCDEQGIEEAAALLRRGELVAFPTETVYGLGANALDSRAVAGIFAAKGRPADNPLITHVASIEDALALAQSASPMALNLMQTYWPGPLTLVLPRSSRIPDIVAAGLPTFAVRLPAHPGARALIARCGLPLAAPSANLSGRPSPTTARHTYEDMQGRIPLILDGGECGVGLESTVLDVSRENPVLLRPGGITVEMIQKTIGRPVAIARGVDKPLQAGEKAASPGMLHRHYAPKAPMRIVKNASVAYDRELALGGIPVILADRIEDGRLGIALGEDIQTMGKALFSALRQADEMGATLILFQGVSQEGIGRAIMNRALRAAGFNEEEA